MNRARKGSSAAGAAVGLASVLALAGACDSGSSTDAGSGGSSSGTAGVSASGGAVSGAGGGSAGALSGGSAGVSATGGTAAGLGGNPGSAGSAGSDGSAGDGSAGDGGGGEGGDRGLGGEAGSAAGASGAGGEDGGSTCGGRLLSATPRESSVMFLVDRSGSMFAPMPEPWSALRSAALPVIDEYDGLVDLGFMAMTGEMGTCPMLDEIVPAANNYQAIKAKYDALAAPLKGESPFMLALSRAGQLLAAASEAEKYIVFVIDGEADYCNDHNPLCAIDSVVARIQALHAAGVTTLVAGLPHLNPAMAVQHSQALQSYANAGVGLPVASVGDTPANIYFQCNVGDPPAPSWPAEFAASGKPAQQALGSYSTTPGGATYGALDPADVAGSSATLRGLLAQTKSCTFELSRSVDPAQAESGVVQLKGQELTFGSADGWSLNENGDLKLAGSACDTWRLAGAGPLSVDFPCAAIED